MTRGREMALAMLDDALSLSDYRHAMARVLVARRTLVTISGEERESLKRDARRVAGMIVKMRKA